MLIVSCNLLINIMALSDYIYCHSIPSQESLECINKTVINFISQIFLVIRLNSYLHIMPKINIPGQIFFRRGDAISDYNSVI